MCGSMADIQSATARLGEEKERKKDRTNHSTKIHCESKKVATLIMAITLSILGGFAKFFHC